MPAEMDWLKSSTNILFTLMIFVVIISPLLVNGFGYDSGTSCSPKASRRGRAQLLATIPCDLSIQGYCNLPGSAYPWHAVRRFVHENQGLMKRMYGDVRHISVLRTEIENNDIELEDIAETAARYSRSGQRKTKYLYSTDFQNSRNNEVLSEPHFRPTSTSTTTTTTTTTTPTTPSTTPSAVPTTDTDQKMDSKINYLASKYVTEKYSLDNEDVAFDESVETNSVYENVTEDVMENIKVVKAPNLNPANQTQSVESATISTTLKIITNFSGEKMPPDTLIRTTTNLPSLDESDDITESVEESSIPDLSVVPLVSSSSLLSSAPSSSSSSSSANERIDVNVNDDDIIENSKNVDASNNYFGTVNNDEKPKHAKPHIGGNMEGQLFQDAVQKEAPIVNTRGINACPVKEEVVAPFWANNTRGEVLALLNLYPFEQYVHWEKCTHEHKQMYCRDGCRCEQQYRLHRLLAYDPHNECRGIFSDWFRFPSCCICKCYDIPNEFRVTSRSPRSSPISSSSIKQERHPIETVEDELQKAIYEHATEDWYRPKDHFVQFDEFD